MDFQLQKVRAPNRTTTARELSRETYEELYDRAGRIIEALTRFPEQEDMDAVIRVVRSEFIWIFLEIRIHAAGGGAGGFSGSSCAICLCDFSAGERIGILGCGHEFHAHCLHPWLMIRNECPVCRQPAIEDLV